MARKKQTTEEAGLDAIGEGVDTRDETSDNAGQPSYKVIGKSKIPVSKVRGKLWRGRRDAGIKLLRDTSDAWDESLAYYHNTQDAHRQQTGNTETAGNASVRIRKNRILSENENIVFANASSLVPALYAKSPEITITGNNDELKDLYECVEQVGNAIIIRQTHPGINLTPKVRKSIISAALTNEGWIEIGWTFKDQSSDQALADLQRLSDEFAETKDLKRLKEIEGEIQALEHKIEILTPSGPWAKYRENKQVLVDPNSCDDDGSDANWMMIWDMIPTNALNAMYADKDKNGTFKSVYKPTHVMSSSESGTSDIDDQVKNFRLFTNEDDKNKDRDESCDVTKCWFIYDKTTRRIELYHDKNWSWPIWVWEDYNKIDRFFPLYSLKFHTSPTETRMKGEVSYYLDQVDAINEMNDAEARARESVKNSGLFNSNIGVDEKLLQEIIRGGDGTWRGVKVPDGMKLDDVVVYLTPEYLKFMQLFDANAKQNKLHAIDRISSVTDVMRGAQFKTNTTNKAIDQYNSVSNTRLDDRVDQIENFIGNITWGVLQLCLQNMPQEVVAILVGSQRASVWKQMAPDEINMAFASCRVEGGSTSKPNSRAKKEEALELMQVLGQFVQAAPGPVTKVMFRIGERAFDEFVMTDLDWQELNSVIGFQMQTEAAGVVPPGGAPAQDDAQLQQLLQQVPPELQQAVQKAIEAGAPPEEAVAKVLELSKQTQPTQ